MKTVRDRILAGIFVIAAFTFAFSAGFNYGYEAGANAGLHKGFWQGVRAAL